MAVLFPPERGIPLARALHSRPQHLGLASHLHLRRVNAELSLGRSLVEAASLRRQRSQLSMDSWRRVVMLSGARMRLRVAVRSRQSTLGAIIRRSLLLFGSLLERIYRRSF